jgi:hypothetical protein
MEQQNNFTNWLAECRNYGLTVTKERLIKSINTFDHDSYQFAMSPNAKTMIVLIEGDKECEHDDV